MATYTAAACDVTPIFVCNPFEYLPGTPSNPLYDGRTFNEHFEDGNMYGRLMTMTLSGSATPGPGNFGFLRTVGTGGSVLRDALATGSPGVCYKQEGLDTEPGGTIGPVRQGLNARFGIYEGSMGSASSDPKYRPAKNIRKGQKQGASPSCSKWDPEANVLDAMPFPLGNTETSIPGGKVSGNVSSPGTWDLDTYWDISHGTHSAPLPSQDPGYSPPAAPVAVSGLRTTLPSTATATISSPSRYDVYQYEIAQSMIGDAAPNGETGSAMCYSGYNLADYTDDRRAIFAAVLNCHALAASGELKGASTDLPAEAFARMFLTKPVPSGGSVKEINLEMVDVTGEGGRGTLEDFLREEAELVR